MNWIKCSEKLPPEDGEYIHLDPEYLGYNNFKEEE